MKDVRFRQQCMRNNRYDLSAQTGAILKEMLTLQRLTLLRNETGKNGEKRLPLHDFYHIWTRCVQYLELLPTGDIHILQNSLSSFKISPLIMYSFIFLNLLLFTLETP